MRIALHKLLSKEKKWRFQKAEFEENTIELQNPARGWYKIFPFMVEEEPDFDILSWCDEDKNTLALVIINIGEYRDENLPNSALVNIRRILDFFVKKKYDMILRITYDHLGHALEREPFFFSQVKTHLEQLVPIIHEYKDYIFVYQGMLIGNWGEMHTSKFLSPQKLKEMWQIMQSNIGEDVYFAVRKPSFWRLLHPQSCDSPQLICDKMGLFDDAIFGSNTHLGTFGSTSREHSGWEALWNRESELNFENELCLKVPNGGEALSGELFLKEGSILQILDTLKRMHITYLNEAYDKVILDSWKQWNCAQGNIWQNQTLYEYIGAHLGYRFVVRDASVKSSEDMPNKLFLQIHIENSGFANLYHEADLVFEWTDEKKNEFSTYVDYDLRSIDSSTTTTLTIELPENVRRMWLSAYRKKDGRRICFANRSLMDEKIYLGQIVNCSDLSNR